MISSARTLAVLGAIAMLLAASLTFSVSDRLAGANENASNARNTTLQAYRIAQSLKSLAAGYELTLNEYYSTVLEVPAYRQKILDHRLAINRELTALASLYSTDFQGVEDLKRIFGAMESYRAGLEKALSGSEQDWDAAREALYKLNVLSVQTIRQADTLANIAAEQARAQENEWSTRYLEAVSSLRVAITVLLTATVGLLLGAWYRRGEIQPGSSQHASA